MTTFYEDAGDAPADLSTPYAMSVGDAFEGRLNEIGDRDWIAIDLTAGTGVQIALNGIGEDQLRDPYLHLHDAGGVRVRGNDDGGPGLDSLLRYTTSEDGTYYLVAAAYANRSQGDYELVVTEGGLNLQGTVDADLLTGSERDDTLAGLDGDDTLEGLAGDDLLTGGADADELDGGEGADTLDGGDGADSLVGGPGDDWVYSGAGHNTLDGGAGDDTLWVLDGDDTIDGGDGYDRVNFYSTPYLYGEDRLLVSLSEPETSTGSAAGTFLANVEVVAGDRGHDTLIGAAGGEELQGRQGDDRLAGLDGADTLRGGAGFDEIDYSASDAALRVSLESGWITGGHASGDVIEAIEHVLGTGFGDLMLGDRGDNRLRGMDGEDTLLGGAGDDTIMAGDGHDRLFGQAGADVLMGGAGDDSLGGVGGADALMGGDGNDTLSGGWGEDTLYGGAGDDDLSGGAGADLIGGGDGFDTADYGDAAVGVAVSLYTPQDPSGAAEGDRLFSIEALRGSAFDDTLEGNAGINVLEGRAGADTLFGYDGADTLAGGAGTDRLSGGLGDDLMTGGVDADSFVYRSGHGADTISDFALGEDLLVVESGAYETSVVDGAAVLAWEDGGTVTLEGVTDLAALEADVALL